MRFTSLPFLLILMSACNNSGSNKTSLNDTAKKAAIIKTIDTTAHPITDNDDKVGDEEIAESTYAHPYDTIIKGGYSLSYYHDSTDQYLIYKKGRTIIDTIADCSLGLRYKNLGYIGADFEKMFVFVHSYGLGNPHYISVLDKATARNLIQDGGAWIGVDTTKEVLLYSQADVPEMGDSMILFDTKRMTQKKYAFPKELFAEPEILNRITLINVSDKAFTIEYEYNDRNVTKRKEYQR